MKFRSMIRSMSQHNSKEPIPQRVLNVLVLEDDPYRQKLFKQRLYKANLEVVDSVCVAIACLKNKEWDYLFLDHDLGGQQFVTPGENTGYAVACWLEKNPERQPKNIIIHSLNPVGATAMQQALPKAKYIPGCWMDIDIESHNH